MNKQIASEAVSVRAAHIAEFLGVACEGNDQLMVRGTSSITELRDGTLSFLKRHEPAWIESLRSGPRAALIVALDTLREHCAGLPQTFIYTQAPRLDFARVVERFLSRHGDSVCLPERGVHPTALVHPEAAIDPSARIGAYAILDRCRIGPGVVIHPHVHVFDDVEIRANVIIHHGCTLGTHGFGFELSPQGQWIRMPHLGGLCIEEDVEVFPHANIDRAAVGQTRVGKGTKIDHYCHIGHAVQLGRHCIITAGAILGGSAQVGDYTWIGPNANVMNGAKVGRNVMIGMGAVVTRDVEDNVVVAGVPAKVLRANKSLPFETQT